MSCATQYRKAAGIGRAGFATHCMSIESAAEQPSPVSAPLIKAVSRSHHASHGDTVRLVLFHFKSGLFILRDALCESQVCHHQGVGGDWQERRPWPRSCLWHAFCPSSFVVRRVMLLLQCRASEPVHLTVPECRPGAPQRTRPLPLPMHYWLSGIAMSITAS